MELQSNYFFSSHSQKITEFWDRNFHELLHQTEQFDISNDNCVRFYKKTKIFKKWLSRVYSVQSNYLLYGDTKPKGFRKLECVYLYTSILEEPYKYQIVLTYFGKSVELYTDIKKDFDTFKEILQQHCILTDFHTQFTLLKQIGFGSSAQVYIARNNYNKLLFAIKRVQKLYSVKQKKQELEQSLINEISIMKQLNHPNIITYYQLFETNKHINIVLELIQGGELLKQGQYKSIRDARIVSRQLALCVDYIHQKGFMHRDLKPQNILCKSNNLEVMIADFGLATQIKQQQQQYYRCGTTGYVAPEVIQHKEGQKMYSEKCDIFSLGVIFYQLFYNQHPFKDSNKQIMLKKNVTADYKFDETIKVPNSCKELIAAMLKINPKLRPSASQILRHEFFNEALNELSYPSLMGSVADISDMKKSAQSFNSQIGELKFSTFQKNILQVPEQKGIFNVSLNHQSVEFKEMSPLWNKKIDISKINSQARSKAQSMYSNRQSVKNLDIRNPKISIFRQQSRCQSESEEFEDINVAQIPYSTIKNKCLIKKK